MIDDAASASLFIIFVEACVVLPVIAGCAVLAYAVFRGEARDLRYR